MPNQVAIDMDKNADRKITFRSSYIKQPLVILSPLNFPLMLSVNVLFTRIRAKTFLDGNFFAYEYTTNSSQLYV